MFFLELIAEENFMDGKIHSHKILKKYNGSRFMNLDIFLWALKKFFMHFGEYASSVSFFRTGFTPNCLRFPLTL